MKELLLHDNTAKQINNLLKSPPQALLISGLPGSGKQTIGRYIASKIMRTNMDELESQPFYIGVNKPDGKQDIPIDTVRQVIKNLSLKSKKFRIVHIKQAHLLNQQSQNTLLKIMEEPPDKTIFLLGVPSLSYVLPTIVSRTQTVQILPVTLSQARDYFKEEYKTEEIDSAWNLSRGQAGLMTALLSENTEHPLKNAVGLAKLFLKMNRYERLIYLDKISGDKPQIAIFLDALNRVLAALSAAAVKEGKNSQIRTIVAARRMVGRAQDGLENNTSLKLLSLELALKLPV